MNRRQFIALFGSGVFAGCSNRATPATTTTNETPTTSSPTTSQSPPSTTTVEDGRAGPALSCPAGHNTFHPTWVVEGPGPLAGFDLTTTQSLTVGQRFTATLQNVTSANQHTGNKHKYDIQIRAADGWHTIFGLQDHAGWTDEAIGHKPNQGFTWPFPFTTEGLTDLVENSPYRVCGPVTSGTYRFVYWGITTEQEANEDYETDYALGVPFTVTKD